MDYKEQIVKLLEQCSDEQTMKKIYSFAYVLVSNAPKQEQKQEAV